MGGIFGVISTKKCCNDLFYGTDYHSHLGTRRAGLAVYNGNGIFRRDIHSIENSYFRIKFEDDLAKYTGNLGIGCISDTDAQPILVNSHLGRFAIVTVGKICNIEELEKEILSQNRNFTELSSGKTNPTELVALLITSKPSYTEGIKYLHSKIKGSCSFLILTEHSIIASRDQYGRTPLILAKKEVINDKGEKVCAHAVTTESCCLPNIQYKEEYILGPGETLEIDAHSFTQLIKPGTKKQICSFLWIYYGFPASNYENINVDEVRYNLGINLAHDEDKDIDIVSTIPDSGTCMAIGFSQGLKIPFRNAYVKYTPTWPRSFTTTNQEMRSLVAKMKLIPNGAILKGKRLAFCDDYIIRGTQLGNNSKNLYNYGAKEIHIRISCPPYVYPCPFLNFSQSRNALELMTRKYIAQREGSENKNLEKYTTYGTPEYNDMVEYMRKEINVDSLKFCTIDNLVKSIGLPKEMICTHCFDGSSYGY